MGCHMRARHRRQERSDAAKSCSPPSTQLSPVFLAPSGAITACKRLNRKRWGFHYMPPPSVRLAGTLSRCLSAPCS